MSFMLKLNLLHFAYNLNHHVLGLMFVFVLFVFLEICKLIGYECITLSTQTMQLNYI